MFQFSTMALEQTLALSSTTSLFFSFPKNPITNIKIPILSPNPLSSSSEKSLPKRSLKCSVDYRDNHYSQTATHAKPDEIQWNKELCNSVHLIGVVGIPVEIKHLPSGKVVAWTRLAVKKSATDTSWINLTFWDELAHVASQHVEKGQQIYVSGRLISDSVENDDGKLQTYYKVVVQQLNFIERSSPTGLYDRGSNNMEAGRKLGNNSANDMGSTEERWQAFFANPMEWWDNRKDKRNPKYPDFKHKDTGEALWVEGRYNPSWVKSQLAILDERMGSLRDQDSRLRLSSMSGDDFMSFS
ncbi:SINGLE-STRANDED DNA-BINDING PROTEIN [Salix purpurea]|uniref:SINGLE-STRANDED DNA-BINDING PROTEIN n=1 Tax=Salix purpurea TaxID=77065 RepID=A0A9Q0PBI8_SALPP|nr:SINGLE-STRANDED DNA-BINDING PROTEIN [Salix purpurea]